MYSMQHVLWRGVMALSLMVVGGLGAYSSPVGEASNIACRDNATLAYEHVAANVVAYRHVQFDTIVVHGTPPVSEDA